jgi:hypothetical protein
MLTLINPVERAEPFNHADWVFKAKFDGFRAAADTVRGRFAPSYVELLSCLQIAKEVKSLPSPGEMNVGVLQLSRTCQARITLQHDKLAIEDVALWQQIEHPPRSASSDCRCARSVRSSAVGDLGICACEREGFQDGSA